jgi:hypothetical protein
MTDTTAALERHGVDAYPPGGVLLHPDDFMRSMRRTRPDRPHYITLLVPPWLFDPTLQPAEPADDAEKTEPPPSGATTNQAPAQPEDFCTPIWVVPTNIRQVWPDPETDEATAFRLGWGYKYPEYEADGWLHGSVPGHTGSDKVWVRLSLRTEDTEDIMEIIVYLLEPGEEHGTIRTPGMGG